MNGNKTNQVFRVYRYAPDYAGLPDDIAVSVKADMNGDGSLNLPDAIMTLQICVDESPSLSISLSEADINGDVKIGLAEAVYILSKISEMR